MFREMSREDELSVFFGDVLRDDDSFRQRLISMLARLDTSDWEELEHMARKMLQDKTAAERADERPPWDSEAAKQAEWEREADEFAAMAREQFLSEKLRESQALSVKESDGPGGVA